MTKLVVITGARGYLGSALAERLDCAGYALRLVSRVVSSNPSASARSKRVYWAADLRDSNSWMGLLHDADAVVHLSSRTDLRAAEADPADDNDINVRPVGALVDAARRLDKPLNILFASAATI